MASPIPKTGTRSTIDAELKAFLLDEHKDLRLGGANDPRTERAHHLEVFGFHSLPKQIRAPIGHVEDIAIPGPHGSIPVRAFYPTSGEARAAKKDAAALVYFHGGGYTVGSVDEFENASRLIAEAAETQVYTVEYRLAPEWSFPVQLDEYDAVIDWLQGNGGKERGVNPSRVCGGGDSAGGNMTAAVSLRRLDDGKSSLKAQILLYPEARLPFDTPAAAENNSGMYLECNGIFAFANNYATRGTAPSHRYVSPGMQAVSSLRGLPPASIFTCGFDPLRDVGIEYASKLQEAGNSVTWHHYDNLTHGFAQFAPWSKQAMKATEDVAADTKRLAYA